MEDNIINKQALLKLAQQDWKGAQTLFFENAKKNPSNKTYNNLGKYLIDEGLECKNGKVRNAYKLGIKYLKKAVEKELSPITLCALAEANENEFIITTGEQRAKVLRESKKYLEMAREINYTNEIQYNYLRICYMLGEKDNVLLEQSRKLILEYVCEESISLYFALLSDYMLIDEALECIKNYEKYIYEPDLLLFYVKFGLYEKGLCLCDVIKRQYSPDKYIIAAIIECYVNTEHYEEAKNYVKFISEIESEIQSRKDLRNILEDSKESVGHRKKIISEYSMVFPFVKICCYFGCPTHKTIW